MRCEFDPNSNGHILDVWLESRTRKIENLSCLEGERSVRFYAVRTLLPTPSIQQSIHHPSSEDRRKVTFSPPANP